MSRPVNMSAPSAADGDQPASAEKSVTIKGKNVPDIELTADECAELLDPGAWENILALYARTMGLAVALIDAEGRLLGTCHNARPVWSLAREKKPDWGTGCLFCLEPDGRCTAAAEAVSADAIAMAHDRAGFAHIAAPLSLGGRHLGTLLAGQVFDRFPEPIPLQRMARDFGLSAQEVWHLAGQEAPIGRARLALYGELLRSLGQTFLRERYSTVLEKRLAETNLRFHLLVDGVKEYAIFTVDEAGIVTSWNAGAERLLGYTDAEILGMHFSRMFVPSDIAEGVPRLDLLKAGRDGRAVNERSYVRQDGTHLFVSSILAPLSKNGHSEFVMIMHDITDRLKAGAALLQKEKLESLGILAGGVAHDFNNLLTGIVGHASLLLDGPSGFERYQSSLESIVSAGDRAAALISQMLSYAGKGQFALTKFNLSQTVAKMLGMLMSAVPAKVQLEFSLAPELPAVEADLSKIQQVVMNLVTNSAEAMDSNGGTVFISTGRADVQPDDEGESVCRVYLEVRDTGCGMDEAALAKIFDPFFTTKFMGRGLGLAAVSGIVRAHKGTVQVQSTRGKGTTFRIYLPGLPGQPEKGGPPLAVSVAEWRLNGAKGEIECLDTEFLEPS